MYEDQQCTPEYSQISSIVYCGIDSIARTLSTATAAAAAIKRKGKHRNSCERAKVTHTEIASYDCSQVLRLIL